MAFSLAVSPSLADRSVFSLRSDFLPSTSLHRHRLDTLHQTFLPRKKPKNVSLSVSCSATKIVRDRSLDKHIVKQNKVRFVQKLKTLLLSKPKHFMPIQILSKCRSYLNLPKHRSVLSMIHRYPTIFELFTIPWPPMPMNATRDFPQLCVRLSPAAEALASDEARLNKTASTDLAAKLQKLLMLSTHRRLLLSKLAHLGPDLGLPPNFRSRLCNEYPEKFKTVDTSYGRALELVSWDPDLANPFPKMKGQTRDLIVDRPLKFKQLNLRKGLNLKRSHNSFLMKFEELPEICPYKMTVAGEFQKESIESEKRACGVVREVLGMTLEKRTLVDHLTHFRKDFGLPNKLRGMLVRHPELFYISLKGERDSAFLVEAYDDNGVLIKKDETLVLKERLFTLVMEGKRSGRGRRKVMDSGGISLNGNADDVVSYNVEDYIDDTAQDGIDQLFDWDDPDFETLDDDDDDDDDGDGEGGDYSESSLAIRQKKNFWTTGITSYTDCKNADPVEPW